MEISLDKNQKELLAQLDKIKLVYKKNATLFNKIKSYLFLRKKDKILSLYIYGKVGRGKSMLMKNFYHDIKSKNKIYFHFNDFMIEVHKQMHNFRKNHHKHRKEIIEVVIDAIIGKSDILCFDEFYVEDVADALIMKKIFSFLFKKKILIIFTSNFHPRNLYLNGLQREVFIQFIDEVLEKNCTILNLDSKTDYRTKAHSNLYFINKKHEFDKKYYEIIDDKKVQKVKLSNSLSVNKFNKYIILRFEEIFNNNFGIKDYKLISNNCSMVIFLNFLCLKNDPDNSKRVMLFIDELYERKISLMIFSENKIENLFKINKQDEGGLKRTISRITYLTSSDE